MAGLGSVALKVFSASLLPIMSSTRIHSTQCGFLGSMGWLSIWTVTLRPMSVFSNLTIGTWVLATASFQGPKDVAVYGSFCMGCWAGCVVAYWAATNAAPAAKTIMENRTRRFFISPSLSRARARLTSNRAESGGDFKRAGRTGTKKWGRFYFIY